MNKTNIILATAIILLLGYIFFGGENLSDSQSQQGTNSQSLDLNFIQPPKIINNTLEDVNLSTPPLNNIDQRQARLNSMVSSESEDQEMLNNLGSKFITLGEILDRPVDNTIDSSVNLLKDIQRAKYNLKIAKQMAAMTKNIYTLDENGVRQLNQKTLDEIHELRKKLIVQVQFNLPETDNK